jgi:Ca-activated chloride channel family protein
MIVFDASGLMSGDGWGYGSETAGTVSRLEKVRAAHSDAPRGAHHLRSRTLQPMQRQARSSAHENAASSILGMVKAMTPAGKTPLTSAVAQAADVLDSRHKPGLIVVVTDGEETCGGSPCELGKQLHAEVTRLTVHVISLRVRGLSWMGEQSVLDPKCLENGGLTVETQDELKDAVEETLGCPMVTESAKP